MELFCKTGNEDGCSTHNMEYDDHPHGNINDVNNSSVTVHIQCSSFVYC